MARLTGSVAENYTDIPKTEIRDNDAEMDVTLGVNAALFKPV